MSLHVASVATGRGFLGDLDRLQAQIHQRAAERQQLWAYGGVRRLAAPQVARLAQLTAELDRLFWEKRSLLTSLGSLCWEDLGADPAGWLYLLARPQVRPPDPQLRQPWRQAALPLGERAVAGGFDTGDQILAASRNGRLAEMNAPGSLLAHVLRRTKV